MSKTAHVAAPVPLELNGKTYLLTPLTVADLRELERFLQEDAINSVKGTLEGLSVELALGLLEKAHEEKLRRRIGTASFDAASQSFNGISYMFWLGLRKKHPEIDRETTMEMMTADNLALIMAKVNEAAGFTTPDGESVPLAGKP